MPEALTVGSNVRVAGKPSKRSATRLFGTNLRRDRWTTDDVE